MLDWILAFLMACVLLAAVLAIVKLGLWVVLL